MADHSTLPPAFEERIKARLGQDFDAFIQSLHAPAPVSLRLNPHKRIAPPSDQRVAWAAEGYYLNTRPSFTRDPHFHAGTYYVQEASSMFLEQAITQTLDRTQPLRILDVCAAPGGKSTHILSLLNKQSLLVSNEVIRSRATILAENIQKWGHHQSLVTTNDPEDFGRFTGFFDAIVLDAPCSGEGLFRKDLHARDEWSVANADLCSKRQQRILADVWPALKEDGILIYSTCTYNEAENEANLVWLARQHDVEFVSLHIDPAWNIESIHHEGASGYQFYPHRVRGEGFFLAVVRKKEKEQTVNLRTKAQRTAIPATTSTLLSSWIHAEAEASLQAWQQVIYMVPQAQADAMHALQQHLNIVQAGTYLASFKHDKAIPEHALAMSIHRKSGTHPEIQLSLEEALHYLRKEALPVSSEARGFALATFEGIPLGWLNLLGNRANNLYPTDWRIRMAV